MRNIKLRGRVVEITDQSEKNIRLPILGKIKVGQKVERNGKQIPTSLDHFRATGKFERYFNEQFGENCSQLRLVFLSDDVGEVCSEYYECRDSQGRLTALGDGESYYVYRDQKPRGKYELFDRGEEGSAKREQATQILKGLGTWKHVLRLVFLLPELRGVMGLWELRTHGTASSIPSITAAFDTVLSNCGTVKNIPFDLIVEKVKSNKPGAASVYPVLTMVPNLSKEAQLTLREFLSEGKELGSGMLTEDKILELKPRQ